MPALNTSIVAPMYSDHGHLVNLILDRKSLEVHISDEGLKERIEDILDHMMIDYSYTGATADRRNEISDIVDLLHEYIDDLHGSAKRKARHSLRNFIYTISTYLDWFWGLSPEMRVAVAIASDS